MQISNNYQTNFRAATVDRGALKILSQRLKPEELKPFIKKI